MIPKLKWFSRSMSAINLILSVAASKSNTFAASSTFFKRNLITKSPLKNSYAFLAMDSPWFLFQRRGAKVIGSEVRFTSLYSISIIGLYLHMKFRFAPFLFQVRAGNIVQRKGQWSSQIHIFVNDTCIN